MDEIYIGPFGSHFRIGNRFEIRQVWKEITNYKYKKIIRLLRKRKLSSVRTTRPACVLYLLTSVDALAYSFHHYPPLPFA